MSNLCYHCQAKIPDGIFVQAEINGQTRAFCCHACLGVASIIDGHDLNQYYQVRDNAGLRPEQQYDHSHWQAYDIPAIADQYVFKDGEDKEIHLFIDGIHCSACSWLIRSALKDIHGIDNVQVNTTTGRAQIRWQDSQLSAILQTLSELGYTPNLYTPAENEQHYHRQRNQHLLRLIVAGLGMMQVMMFATGLYTGAFHGIEQHYANLLRWISFAIAMPVLFYAGYPILRSATLAVRSRRINMDVPIAIATVCAFIASAYHTMIGRGEIYFDSVTMFIFFISISRYLEFLTRRRAQLNEFHFARLLPDAVYKLSGNDRALVPLTTIQPQDVIEILPTHTIPIDGTILSGHTRVDESMLTGESTPIYKTMTDEVFAGSVNIESPITIAVTKTGQQTTLAGIRRIIARAEQHRSPQILRNERIARGSIIFVLVFALAGFIGWQFIDAARAFEVALAILVATCPCALSLATPAALTSALNHAHRFGILIKDSHTIDRLTTIQHIIFDKTGTLSEGNFQLIDYQFFTDTNARLQADDIWSIAKTLERQSTHPIAWYFSKQPVPALPIANVHQATGAGVKATIDGKTYAIGSAAWIKTCFHTLQLPTLSSTGTHVFLADEQALLAWFVFDDPLRQSLAQTLADLAPYQLHIASGDHAKNVSKVAQALGIKSSQGNLSAEEKWQFLQSLTGEIMMVGDGINDAPVLAAADVSVAVGKANPLSQIQADIVLLNQGPQAIPFLFHLAKKTQQIIKQNLVWASVYNLTILPLAICGYLTPWMAALGMSISSLLVVGNAMRVNKIPLLD